ncbi:MAG: thiol-disulfide oxidoreductase [Leptolyngbya foveolarum]|uniref:Thiol-disulfide oxidoreductase n=1 Tax=Leptolyngbya foveolarum TaxID=47253 RepID=A0A2W4TQX3_9CYAN|nr:MAG: thiol-disulfide oxidoreductase [Leptolyngbya foveolarum]
MVSSQAKANSTASTAKTSEESPDASWKINLLYDGDCPLCLREVNFLQKKDAGRGIVKLTDIADIDYRPKENGGVDFETAMGRIHAVKADGTVVKNVAVFQEVYDALGIGWMYAPTKWPVMGPLVNKIYDLWADKRLAMTGRASLKEVIAQREEKIARAGEGRCRLEEA